MPASAPAGHLLLEPGDEVLDLAGGAGHLSRALASRARRFVVLDLTPEQIAVERRATARETIANVEFMEGDACHAPFADASFDLVMSRFALHHMAHPAVAVHEAGRVCRRGGRVAPIDMAAPSDAATAARFNELERLRDPSHTSALSARALEALIAAEGTIVSRDTRDHALPVDPWLERARTPATDRRTVIEALERELAGGPPTGMRPDREGGWRNAGSYSSPAMTAPRARPATSPRVRARAEAARRSGPLARLWSAGCARVS